MFRALEIHTSRFRWRITMVPAWAWKHGVYGWTHDGFERYWRVGKFYIQRWQYLTAQDML